MHKRVAYGAVFLGLLVLCAQSFAVGVGLLPNDPNAYNDGTNPVWRGIRSYSNFVSASNNLKADVEYAVYAPGAFNVSFPGMDPSGGTDFVYAYQIFNEKGGNKAILNLTVGMSPDLGNRFPANIGGMQSTISGFNGLDQTSNTRFNPTTGVATSAVFNFGSSGVSAGTGLATNRFSDILIFTSPFKPRFDNGSLQANINGQTLTLPSPTTTVPEPTTIVLAGLGVIGLLLFRCGRRRISR